MLLASSCNGVACDSLCHRSHERFTCRWHLIPIIAMDDFALAALLFPEPFAEPTIGWFALNLFQSEDPRLRVRLPLLDAGSRHQSEPHKVRVRHKLGLGHLYKRNRIRSRPLNLNIIAALPLL